MKARVIKEHKTNYIIKDGGKEYTATVRGSFFTGDSFPKVGDFVTYTETTDEKAVIEKIVPRTSTISRKAVGTTGEQVIVANVDVVFIVMGLDGDFNLSRLERYLLLAQQGNVTPVVILNKSDSVADRANFVEQAREIAKNIGVQAVSAVTGENMETLLQYLGAGTTAVLLGSSGAGKSTITNWLLRADTQPVQSVRNEGSHGRHTTTARELFTLPSGAFLIDTPGMRELGIQSTQEDEELVFEALETLARNCQFPNCDHQKSKGCAILPILDTVDVTKRQLDNYIKLQQERIFTKNKMFSVVGLGQTPGQKSGRKGYR